MEKHRIPEQAALQYLIYRWTLSQPKQLKNNPRARPSFSMFRDIQHHLLLFVIPKNFFTCQVSRVIFNSIIRAYLNKNTY